MKRINPDTKKPFKQGYEREDGFVFWGYQKKIGDNGYRGEMWISKDKMIEKKRYLKSRSQNPNYRAGLILTRAKRRCTEKQKGKVTITQEDIARKILNGVCEFTGLPFDLKQTVNSKNNLYAPSLDRIDNNNPDYSSANTRLVLVGVNQTLNEHGERAVLPILKAMVLAIEKNIL
jgi:hypothetical protein